jgi:hypothetical protein
MRFAYVLGFERADLDGVQDVAIDLSLAEFAVRVGAACKAVVYLPVNRTAQLLKATESTRRRSGRQQRLRHQLSPPSPIAPPPYEWAVQAAFPYWPLMVNA